MALNSEQIEKVRGLLQSSGWREVVKPVLDQRALNIQKIFRLLPSERSEPYKNQDDMTVMNLLRGRLEEIEWFAAAFANEVSVYDMNQRQDETQRQANPAL